MQTLWLAKVFSLLFYCIFFSNFTKAFPHDRRGFSLFSYSALPIDGLLTRDRFYDVRNSFDEDSIIGYGKSDLTTQNVAGLDSIRYAALIRRGNDAPPDMEPQNPVPAQNQLPAYNADGTDTDMTPDQVKEYARIQAQSVSEAYRKDEDLWKKNPKGKGKEKVRPPPMIEVVRAKNGDIAANSQPRPKSESAELNEPTQALLKEVQDKKAKDTIEGYDEAKAKAEAGDPADYDAMIASCGHSNNHMCPFIHNINKLVGQGTDIEGADMAAFALDRQVKGKDITLSDEVIPKQPCTGRGGGIGCQDVIDYKHINDLNKDDYARSDDQAVPGNNAGSSSNVGNSNKVGSSNNVDNGNNVGSSNNGNNAGSSNNADGGIVCQRGQ